MNYTEQEIKDRLKKLYSQLEIKKKNSDLLLSEIENILKECLTLQEFIKVNSDG
jgi:hypothetical protein